MALQSNLEFAGAVYRDRKANVDARLSVDMMTAIYSKQGPALRFDQFRQLLAREEYHSASWIT